MKSKNQNPSNKYIETKAMITICSPKIGQTTFLANSKLTFEVHKKVLIIKYTDTEKC